MDWIRSHAVLAYGIGVGVVILAGATLIARSVPASPSGSTTWGVEGGAGRFVPSEAFGGSELAAPPLPERFSVSDLYRTLESSPDRFFSSLAKKAGVARGGEETPNTSEVDALLASLLPNTSMKTGEETSLSEAYYYLPTSITDTIPTLTKPMTASQRALYNYGLEAGGPIESYFNFYGSTQAQTFKSFFEEPQNEEKKAAAKEVGRAIFDIGISLEGIYDVPLAVKSAHDRLAASYKEVGRALVPLINSKTDEELLTNLEQYNTLADKLAKNYLDVVTVFTVNEIKYGEGEPGRVFVFSPTTSLPSENGF